MLGAGNLETDRTSFLRKFSQVYLQTNNKMGLVLISATVDVNTGNLTLASTSGDETNGWRIDFAVAHPDGSVSEGGAGTPSTVRVYTGAIGNHVVYRNSRHLGSYSLGRPGFR